MRNVLVLSCVALATSCLPPCGDLVACGFDGGDGGPVDAGLLPSGVARLDGGRAFLTPTAIFTALQPNDAGTVDLSRVDIELRERAQVCLAPNTLLSLSADAGLDRELDVSVNIASGQPLPVGSYLSPSAADSGYVVSVILLAPGGTGPTTPADSSSVVVTKSSPSRVEGTLSAVFPGDTTATQAVFAADFCGTFKIVP